MYEGSLFEKLTGELKTVKYNEKEALYLSIANNLSKIFSTNVGNSQACMDYGKPELNDINLGLEESLSNINKQFAESIRLYEPRLYDVDVKASINPDNLSKIHMVITGFMYINNENMRVKYNAFISGDGMIEVRK